MAALPNFKNKKLFEQAFIHRSYLNEAGEKLSKSHQLVSNERLEFLGDSIIAFLTSEFLYEKFPNLPEGKLTNLRSYLVRTQTLAEVASELDLGRFLKLSRGEEDAHGRENPTLLANSFEAFVGAMFLDSGVKKIGQFLLKVLFSRIDKQISLDSLKDDKSLFQELVQKGKKPTPVYRILKTEGPDHKKTFTIGVFVLDKLWGEGKGYSKQEAEQQAARTALENYKTK